MYANDIEIGERGCSFLMTWHKQFRISISLRLAGIFNVYNALMAAGVCICAGVGPAAIRRGLAAARAVAPLNVLCELLLPFVRVDGRMICWEGPALKDELEAGRRAART